MTSRTALATALVLALLPPGVAAAAPGGGPCPPGSPAEASCLTGTLADGTPYGFAVPPDWNGTVVVALDFAQGGEGFAEPLTASLLADGIARGGTARTVTGWDIAAAIDNQAEALARFTDAYGEPERAIASGRSMGGFVSAGTAQVHPDVFDAAVPFCGGLGGSVAQWNQKLDTLFVLENLVAPGLPVIDVPDVPSAQQAWIGALAGAQGTPEGRARIALAAAIGQLPAWGTTDPAVQTPRPDPHDPVAVQEGAYLALAGGALPYVGQAMSSRPQITRIAGGNPSWNTGVDYAEQLRHAEPALRRAVRATYAAAGLDLDADLRVLADAPRIEADGDAVERFERGIVLDGDLEIPVLTVSNTGDQISTVAQQQSYDRAVHRSGARALLRQTYVESVGHCTFTVGEQHGAIAAVVERLDTGRWPATDPGAMNTRGGEGSRYTGYDPPRFNRHYAG